MKKITAFLAAVLCLAALLTLPAFGAEAAGVAEGEVPEIADYLKETVAPWIVTAVSTVCAVYLMIYPMIVKVRAAKKNVEASAAGFAEASRDVRAAVEERRGVESMTDEVARLRAEVDKMNQMLAQDREQTQALRLRIEQQTGPVLCELKKLREASAVAFGNTRELVEKGYSAKILKIMKEGEGEYEKESIAENAADPL